ncbi:unnamed protein product [Rotaria magnacalcarata]|uniref:SGNH hydrolase-type esterase domain-containing protein n=1 Tax=Rotaria magnacalcarata TaxID=392030 RepID=A0A814X7P0_9BILA|nr:unnamed protein product [Rotaria magnacalcarata]CAF1445938.1 unnamed protein product [Rotaria magnacalcarata]CAF1934645.1 unnamed protein product [Rotaria magnacalcarata]CAF2069784.1 unnamed protein product [Rotaria magnacalcarata]CAF2138774.1 unnamed protein product [Rotaria magnacalcarata]
MDNQHSSSINYFVFGDSHAKCIRSNIAASSYNLITRSISGLKWIDRYDRKLSLYALLSLAEMNSSLSKANAILLLIGTNSVRTTPAAEIILEIQQILLLLQQMYPHLNQPKNITISSTFPSLKTTRPFPTKISLIFNINLYNEELKLLSSRMNFNVIGFLINNNHLANDNMHIQSRFYHLIFDSIINHFNELIQATATTAASNPPLA